MPKADAYTCPRCGYTNQWKKNMKRHFYESKNPCSNKKNLELTDEIKEFVLKHHHYYVPKPEKTNNNKQINYNNNITNYLNGMDTLTKLGHYLMYNGLGVTDINDFVESQHQETVEGMANNSFRRTHLIEKDKFLTLIDDVIKSGSKHEDMNIIYDETLDRIKIYCDDEWTTYFPEQGVRRIIEILRTNYLDPYECYLYKKIFDDINVDGYQKNIIRLKLDEYYKFLAIFDQMPFVYGEQIVNVVASYKPQHPDEFHDYGLKKYEKVKEELTKTEAISTKKFVFDMVKRNHKVNLKKLNDTILDLINVDEEFKKTLFKSLI